MTTRGCLNTLFWFLEEMRVLFFFHLSWSRHPSWWRDGGGLAVDAERSASWERNPLAGYRHANYLQLTLKVTGVKPEGLRFDAVASSAQWWSNVWYCSSGIKLPVLTLSSRENVGKIIWGEIWAAAKNKAKKNSVNKRWNTVLANLLNPKTPRLKWKNLGHANHVYRSHTNKCKRQQKIYYPVL